MKYSAFYPKKTGPARPPRGKLLTVRHLVERLTTENGESPSDEDVGRLLNLRPDIVGRMRRALELLP